MTAIFREPLTTNRPLVLRKTPRRPSKNGKAGCVETRRLHAKAVKRIFDRESQELVGWLYEWNTGDLVPRWIAEAHTDVIYD